MKGAYHCEGGCARVHVCNPHAHRVDENGAPPSHRRREGERSSEGERRGEERRDLVQIVVPHDKRSPKAVQLGNVTAGMEKEGGQEKRARDRRSGGKGEKGGGGKVHSSTLHKTHVRNEELTKEREVKGSKQSKPHPTAHMSQDVVYLPLLSSNSGGRYHLFFKTGK